MCKDLYKLVYDLREQIKNNEKENNKKLNICNQEIKDLREKFEKLEEINKNLIEKINFFEKEILDLKNEKTCLKEKIEALQQKNGNIHQKMSDSLEDKFKEIKNPWTREKDLSTKSFDYCLKNNSYYAEKEKFKLTTIKSMHLFEINRIYKLKYNINYKDNVFRIGFGDFCEKDYRLQTKNSISITDSGLFVEGRNYDSIKIEKSTREIIFIINLKEKPKFFELFIDGKSYGTFNFTIDKIYGLAAFNFGSVTINTSISSI